MKIACVVGARPNFIKLAPIIRALRSHADVFRPVLVHTGQHFDPKMSDVFFSDLEMPRPDHFLNIGSGTQAEQTAAIITRFDELCEEHKFDRVLVVGDVTSTMACAITAAKRQIPVDHVEAGLRSFDRSMPEELNRIITDSLSDLLFVTERSGVENLRREGHGDDRIHLVGNVMIDTLFTYVDAAIARKRYESFNLTRREYALVTLHRPSNVDSPERLMIIVEHLATIAKKVPIVFPVHPRTRKVFNAHTQASNVLGCEPLGYLDFVSMMEGAKFVITDSGGIQEETTALGVPCLTLRTTTERPSTLETGTNTLIGDNVADLAKPVAEILEGRYKTGAMPPLWDGHAAERIVALLRGKGPR